MWTALSRARLQHDKQCLLQPVSAKPEMPSMALAFLSKLIQRRVPCCRSCWALDDQKEGMGAFVQKRKPTFTHK